MSFIYTQIILCTSNQVYIIIYKKTAMIMMIITYDTYGFCHKSTTSDAKLPTKPTVQQSTASVAACAARHGLRLLCWEICCWRLRAVPGEGGCWGGGPGLGFPHRLGGWWGPMAGWLGRETGSGKNGCLWQWCIETVRADPIEIPLKSQNYPVENPVWSHYRILCSYPMKSQFLLVDDSWFVDDL